MKESIATIIEWHTATFPEATLDGQKTKFEEEVAEYNAEPSLMELADMFIVACGIARFDSVAALPYFVIVFRALNDWKTVGCHFLLREVIDDKMRKNRKRVWRKTAAGTYHHIGKEEKK